MLKVTLLEGGKQWAGLKVHTCVFLPLCGESDCRQFLTLFLRGGPRMTAGELNPNREAEDQLQSDSRL